MADYQQTCGNSDFLMIGRQVHSNGYCALQRVLDSPDFDFRIAPGDYSGRGLGGAGKHLDIPVGPIDRENIFVWTI